MSAKPATGAKKEAPCGTWASPISAQLLVSGAVGISEVIPDGQSVWWAESRPSENGRTAIMRWLAGCIDEVTPANANVRTAVHEYGGGAWWVADGHLWYVDHADQRLYGIDAGHTEPQALSPAPDRSGGLRYADMRPHPAGHWLIGVGEIHTATAKEPRNTIVAVATDGSLKRMDLVSGADFYGSPVVSPDGLKLAWVQWQHPNMPWDNTELWRATLRSDAHGLTVYDAVRVAGGDNEAIVQPSWSPDGHLHYLSDRDDRWQLYAEHRDTAVLAVDGEIGYPPWVFGLARYAFKSDGRVVAARFREGIDYLPGYPQFTAFHSVRCSGDNVSFAAASWDEETTVQLNDVVIRPPRQLAISKAFMPAPEVIRFPTGAAEDDAVAHALFYAPAHADFTGAANEKPPLIVLAHGGPTAAARSQLTLALRFWTSRGFAVVDVNYRGSSGFGRRYRQLLDGQWGIADVEDCVAAARYLSERGDVDAQRLIIRGGSAGGFTVLCALAFHDVFTAGASLYGVADLEALARDTHKFESRYLDRLVGPWPEARERYVARSPIHHLEGFTAPMIVLQGSDDKVVPPNQSRMIVDALTSKGVTVEYLEFEGEQHGFRKAETITQAYTAELAFYGKVFSFAPTA